MTDDDTRVQEIIALLAMAGWTKYDEPKTHHSHAVYGFDCGILLHSFLHAPFFEVLYHPHNRIPSRQWSANSFVMGWAHSLNWYETEIEALEQCLKHIIQGDK